MGFRIEDHRFASTHNEDIHAELGRNFLYLPYYLARDTRTKNSEPEYILASLERKKSRVTSVVKAESLDVRAFYAKLGTSGFTLIELMITLAIVAIVSSLAWPSMQDLVRQQRADAIIHELKHAAYLTRTIAISRQQIVSLCPRDDNRCGDDWSQGYFIFSDINNNSIVDEEDSIIEQKQLSLNGQRLRWRASARRNMLRYSPSGMAREFGRFTLCPDDGELRYARTLVVNRQGRVRSYRDRNGDGIVEDRNGDMPECE